MESHHCEQKEKFKLAQIRIASLERNLKVIESRDTQIQRKYEELKTEFQNLKKNILTVGSGEVTRMCTDTSAAAGSASASCTSSTALAPVSMRWIYSLQRFIYDQSSYLHYNTFVFYLICFQLIPGTLFCEYGYQEPRIFGVI